MHGAGGGGVKGSGCASGQGDEEGEEGEKSLNENVQGAREFLESVLSLQPKQHVFF